MTFWGKYPYDAHNKKMFDCSQLLSKEMRNKKVIILLADPRYRDGMRLKGALHTLPRAWALFGRQAGEPSVRDGAPPKPMSAFPTGPKGHPEGMGAHLVPGR